MIASESQVKWYVLFGLVVLALGFHTYNLDHASYDLDEAVHIWHAQKSYADVIQQSSNDPNPPIYNLILSTWVKLFGVSEWTTRFFSVLMGVLGVAVMFLIASRNFGLAVGVAAALLYCFSPIQFRFTHLARPYSMLMVTVLLSYGLLLECVKRPGKFKMLLYYFTTALMIYVHPTSVFNIPAQGLIILLLTYKEPRRMVTLLATMIAAFLTFGVWMMAIPYFERNDSMWFGPPDWNAVYYVIDKFYGDWKILAAQGFILLVLTIQALYKKSKINGQNLMLLAIWMVIPFVASIAFSHLVKPVFQDKYVLTVQPAIILLFAYTAHSLGNRLLHWGLTLGAVTVLIVSGETELHPEGDWKSAVNYLQENRLEESSVFINPWYEFRTFSFYHDRHMYEVPDSTVKLLANDDVFYAWHDVYDTAQSKSKYPILHTLSAHEGFVENRLDENVLKNQAKLIGEKKFIGITLRTYSFELQLDTLYQDVLTFDDSESGISTVLSTDEYSSAIVYSLADAQSNHILRVKASVDFMSTEDLDGVGLVVSTEMGEVKYDYKKLDFTTVSSGNEWQTLTERFTLNQFQNEWEIKVYVWNPSGKQFQMDNLKLIVEN
jgi:hypothetical protein